MKSCIAIPSYQRPDSIIFSRLLHLKIPKFIFVRPEEYTLYSKYEPDFTVVYLPNLTNIGETRSSLVKYLHKLHYTHCFMFDDDISKVETLIETPKGWNSKRIFEGSLTPPGFERDALRGWIDWAVSNKISLSSPVPRFNRKDKGKHWYNSRDCVACVLIDIQDVIDVGNYKSNAVVGAEDMFLQYELLQDGKKIGNYGLAEYDTPSVGVGNGGNNSSEIADLKERYTNYVASFFKVVGDTPLVTTKVSKSGLPSIKFVWREINK